MPKPFRLLALFLWAASMPAQQTTDPEKLFQQAAAAQQRGDDTTAVRIYRELLTAHPGSVEARVNLGASLAQLKHFDEAIEQYREVLRNNPANLPVRLNMGLAYQEKGDLRRAVTELELVHKGEPRNLQASMLLASCYFRMQRYDETISILSPLESELPDDPDLEWMLGSALINSGRAEKGLQRIDKVASTAQSADAYLLAGQTRLQREEYDLAQRDADAASRLNPSLAGLQTLNGMILERTGDYPAAEAALRLSLEENAEDFDAHYYLGAILYFKRDLGGARTQLEKALLLRPASAEARYELALVARAEGKSEEARKELEEVVRGKPNWIQPHIELSTLYYQLKLPQDGARERQIVDHLQTSGVERSAEPIP
jgi:tetratricopeptide (TPR) repeat protein